MQRAKEFLEFIINNLVEDTNAIVIDAKTDEMGVLLTLSVAKEEMGKVIGRNGETAKAIRQLLRAVGAQENARVSFKISEPVL